jgi:hypothetical protein
LNRLKGKYGLYFILCALAALWLSIGSLVHFHQYKIYGKPLLSQVVISKREHDLFAKSFDLKKNSGNPDFLQQIHPDFAAACFIEQNTPPVLFAWHTMLWQDISVPALIPTAPSGLRAPPVA